MPDTAPLASDGAPRFTREQARANAEVSLRNFLEAETWRIYHGRPPHARRLLLAGIIVASFITGMAAAAGLQHLALADRCPAPRLQWGRR